MKEAPKPFAEALARYRITLGAPMLFPRSPEMGFVGLTKYPHVFFSHTLELVSPIKPTAAHPQEHVALSHVMVMFGHGIVEGPGEEEWKFMGTGKSVSGTVRQYDQVASQMGWPSVDIIISCHDEREIASQIYVSLSLGNIPHIYPRSTAFMVNTHDLAYLDVGRGVRMTARAQAWSGVEWWRNYWSAPRNAIQRATQKIPDWAVSASR